MRALGVETSTFTGGVACVQDGAIVAETTLDVRQTHTAVLLPILDRTLRDADWALDSVHCFGVSLGPGSFTSLRIGLATVKGLALQHPVPIVGVCTLRAMAADVHTTALIMPLIDARQDEFYTARYRWVDHELREVAPPAVGPLEELFAGVREPVWCPGNVAPAVAERILAAVRHEVFVPEPRLTGARASVVAQLAAGDCEAGRITAPAELKPVYLRDHLGRKPAA